MSETPEQKARQDIDSSLKSAGWIVQNRDDLDLTAGRGIAVRNFTMKPGFGFADYLLYIDRKAAGAVEAKAEGTLTGVEAQSAKYAAGLPDNLPAYYRPLPFLFESNGSVTFFTNGLDPVPRSRQVFNFPRPETLAEWLAQPKQLRARLNELPPLDEMRLWKVQAQAIRNLEESFGRADPRSPVAPENTAAQLPVPKMPQAAPLAQVGASTSKPGAPSLDQQTVEQRLAAVREAVEQFAVGQDQVLREIAKLHEEILKKIPAPSPQLPALPTRKPMPAPSSSRAPIPPPSSQAPIPPPHP